jgi:hypothetical protein
MSKVVCVLYDDPVDGYPKSYPRESINRPASVAAALIAATTRPASAGGSPCQPVPIRAVRRIAASVELAQGNFLGTMTNSNPHEQR